MGIEIERKFLLVSEDWRQSVRSSISIHQGYISTDAHSVVRVRMQDDRAILGVKSTQNGIYRLEYEYEIPLHEAEEILAHIARKPLIEKVRHIISYGGHDWEVDEFQGANAGLVVAEIELQTEDEPFQRPPWLGEEVSEDPRYFNSSLSKTPYSHW